MCVLLIAACDHDDRFATKNSAKFSRRIIFAFFAEWSGTAKIRRR